MYVMRTEAEIKEKLNSEISAFLTCPKFAVEEHAHNIYALAWALGMSDDEVSRLMQDAEKH